MKKRFSILFVISLGLSGFLSAQNLEKGKVSFGVKAGTNLMTLGKFKTGNQSFDYNYKLGLTAGFLQISH